MDEEILPREMTINWGRGREVRSYLKGLCAVNFVLLEYRILLGTVSLFNDYEYKNVAL